jgi:hypothetical protein
MWRILVIAENPEVGFSIESSTGILKTSIIRKFVDGYSLPAFNRIEQNCHQHLSLAFKSREPAPHAFEELLGHEHIRDEQRFALIHRIRDAFLRRKMPMIGN